MHCLLAKNVQVFKIIFTNINSNRRMAMIFLNKVKDKLGNVLLTF